MKLNQVHFGRQWATTPLNYWTKVFKAALPGEDFAVGVAGLDASIRALAIITVLVLSFFGYGHLGLSPIGISADPLLVALALVAYNLLGVAILGVPWRRPPGFILFAVDWVIVSTAVLVTGGLFSPCMVLYYALIIGAALRVGLSRSLLLVGGCAIVCAALSLSMPTAFAPIRLPILAVSVTSLLMVSLTSVAMRRAVEIEAHKVEIEEHTAGQLRLLNDLTRLVLSGSPDLERVMRTVAAISSQALDAECGLAVLFQAGSSPGQPHIGHRQLIVSDQDPNPQHLSPDEANLAKQAVEAHSPIQVSKVIPQEGRSEISTFPGLRRGYSTVQTVACAPFLLSGDVIGVLFVGRQAERKFTDAEINLLTAIGQQMATAARLARLYEMERERALRSEEREQMERDLLSVVSHELRTPLTAIKTCIGALNSIEESGQTSHSATEAKLVNNIGRSTDRLITLVNESLDMARLRAGRVSLNLQQLNMGEVIMELAPQVKPLLDARQQILEIDLPACGAPRWDKLITLADRRRIEQVLLNLISNSNKYSPMNGKITLGATPIEGQVKVFVRDEGQGIAPGEHERIFEKFYRATPQAGSADNRPDGSGLGLAIARSIVELHGGQIGVQSHLGKGSTFYFLLAAEIYG